MPPVFPDDYFKDSVAIRQAGRLDRRDVERIRELHWRWMLDSEIAAELGVEPKLIWHARQWNGIDRHKEWGKPKGITGRECAANGHHWHVAFDLLTQLPASRVCGTPAQGERDFELAGRLTA